MINSKRKGAVGERAWRDELREAGFCKAYRAQQYSGTESTADVICPELPCIHFEVKYTEKLSLYNAIDQARRDCGPKIPVVAHRKKNCEWVVIMRSEDWLAMIKETGHVKEAVFCPGCKQDSVVKNGDSHKLAKRYRCRNDACEIDGFQL